MRDVTLTTMLVLSLNREGRTSNVKKNLEVKEVAHALAVVEVEAVVLLRGRRAQPHQRTKH